MFDNLSQRLQATARKLRGQARLTDENMAQTLREVRMALLEADVALPVTKAFIGQVKEAARGKEVLTSLTPGQALVKVVHDELVALMGETNDALDLSVRPPAVILVAGLQGAGKTTSVAKLARRLVLDKKKVMLVSADVYRPAAIDQLQRLASEVGAQFFPSDTSQKPLDIARSAIDAARVQVADVLIVDTAGRLHVDADMMDEIKAVHRVCEPAETLFVVDSMTGQDAVNTAKAFDEALPLTGVILTKTDGDARGGAALSIRHVTGKPIKFLGTGEKTDALEPFYPDRLASRILGMGDVVSLVEEVQANVDMAQAEKLVSKIKKGGFDLEDFRDQMMQMEKMGGMAGIMDKLPGMAGKIPDASAAQLGDRQVRQTVAIVNSMTPQERQFPDVIKGSRKRRIASGSGTQVQDVNRVLKQFQQMERMMKKMKKGGMANMLRGMGGRFPGMPF
ncbi:MAG: signal recognition particle protein [Gammaproteobacteria bacterium]|nr:signal recognition particle protein [Gammaproteobacteria bacterium]